MVEPSKTAPEGKCSGHHCPTCGKEIERVQVAPIWINPAPYWTDPYPFPYPPGTWVSTGDSYTVSTAAGTVTSGTNPPLTTIALE